MGSSIYIVMIELKTHILVEVAEELLMGLQGVGGWVLLLYPEYVSNKFQQKRIILIYVYTNIHIYILCHKTNTSGKKGYT